MIIFFLENVISMMVVIHSMEIALTLRSKVQYFIKPEKGQLTSDHKDMDPSKIISKIEVTLKDRKLSQEYDSE